MNPTCASAAQPQRTAWHSQSSKAVLAHLGVAATGLSAQEAAQRPAMDGPNVLPEGQGIRPLHIFLGQFTSLLSWMLIVAGDILVLEAGDLVAADARVVRHAQRQGKTAL